MTHLDPKPYLEYLDKEMTIMGLLSAFSLALASFATEKIVTSQVGFLPEIWHLGRDHVIAGAATAVLSALLFYLQRSHIAWYYGQIALAQTRGSDSPTPLGDWLDQADAWDTWLRYQTAFITLTLSVASYSYAVAEALHPFLAELSPSWSFGLPLFSALAVASLRWYVLSKYSRDDYPFRRFWRSFKRA